MLVHTESTLDETTRDVLQITLGAVPLWVTLQPRLPLHGRAKTVLARSKPLKTRAEPRLVVPSPVAVIVARLHPPVLTRPP